jgi:hypothetical protein
MGLECARPGKAAVHWIPVPCAVSHFTGRFWLSATPEAAGPRKEGQFCAAATEISASTNAVKRRVMALMIAYCQSGADAPSARALLIALSLFLASNSHILWLISTSVNVIGTGR